MCVCDVYIGEQLTVKYYSLTQESPLILDSRLRKKELKKNWYYISFLAARLAGVGEYTNCTSVDGLDPLQMRVLDITLNHLTMRFKFLS